MLYPLFPLQTFTPVNAIFIWSLRRLSYIENGNAHCSFIIMHTIYRINYLILLYGRPSSVLIPCYVHISRAGGGPATRGRFINHRCLLKFTALKTRGQWIKQSEQHVCYVLSDTSFWYNTTLSLQTKHIYPADGCFSFQFSDDKIYIFNFSLLKLKKKLYRGIFLFIAANKFLVDTINFTLCILKSWY